MRDEAIDLCGQVDFTRTDAMPLLERDAQFRFACAGCGNCCRGREDIVLSGYDLWRIAARLRLPPQIVARGYCRSSIGRVSHLPVLRLAPVKENRNNCPFLTENHCAIHEAEPLVCALYPLAQEISRAGEVHYFLQPTGCGGQVIEAKVQDYLARYDVPAREAIDVRWAQTCMALEDTVEQLEAVLGEVAVDPAVTRLMGAGEQPKAPGMKYRHYAPKAPVTVVTGDPKKSAEYIAAHAGAEDGIICFDEFLPLFTRRSETRPVMDLGPAGDKEEQARHIFDALRSFDHTSVPAIWAQCPDTTGIGLAIANRLNKAAGFHIIQV